MYTPAHIHEVLSAISKTFHLPYDRVLACAHTILQPSVKPTLTLKSKAKDVVCVEGDLDMCHAIIVKGKGKQQCSRSKKKGSLCTTHYKEWEENHGKVKGGVISNSPLYASKALDDVASPPSPSTTFPFHVELITVQRIDYLYDRVTRYVYDFDSHTLVGKLQDNGILVYSAESQGL